MSTSHIETLQGDETIVLPFRIPASVTGMAVPSGAVVKVFDVRPHDQGGWTLRVVAPGAYGGTTVRSVRTTVERFKVVA